MAERMRKDRSSKPKIAFFGHFGRMNLGNDSSLLAILESLRRLAPDAEFSCICSGPEIVSEAYSIDATPNRLVIDKPQTFKGPLARWARRLFVAVPRELHQWVLSTKALRGTKVMIVPGTGLLQDAYTFFSWGPYDMFRWSMSARLCGCKLFFVSVGAGPLYTRAGRILVKTALSLAHFRSYRDRSTQSYLAGLGFRVGADPVYPDLVFGLPEDHIPLDTHNRGMRPVVGLGLMKYAGRYSVKNPTDEVSSAYLNTLVEFADWLLVRGYNIRVLTGDVVDLPVKHQFRSLLEARIGKIDEDRVVDEPIESVENLLQQLAATDFVVATRFHNVLVAMVLNKPVMAISFHHKCTSLMEQMGLSDFCQDINELRADELVEHFLRLEEKSSWVREILRTKLADQRHALDEQYAILLDMAGLTQSPVGKERHD